MYKDGETRLLFHAQDGAAAKGYKRLMFLTSDTGKVVLSIAFVPEMDIDSFWLYFAVGMNLGYISAGNFTANLVLAPFKSF